MATSLAHIPKSLWRLNSLVTHSIIIFLNSAYPIFVCSFNALSTTCGGNCSPMACIVVLIFALIPERAPSVCSSMSLLKELIRSPRILLINNCDPLSPKLGLSWLFGSHRSSLWFVPQYFDVVDPDRSSTCWTC
jgi:hypothetical protein